MMMAPLFANKKRAVHSGIFMDVNRRHADGFETHRAAAIGKFYLIGNIEVLTEKTINERTCFFIVFHPLSLSPAHRHAPVSALPAALLPFALISILCPCSLNLFLRFHQLLQKQLVAELFVGFIEFFLGRIHRDGFRLSRFIKIAGQRLPYFLRRR